MFYTSSIMYIYLLLFYMYVMLSAENITDLPETLQVPSFVVFIIQNFKTHGLLMLKRI